MKQDGDRPARPTGRLAALIPAVLMAVGYRRLWFTGLIYYQAHWMEITITGWVVLSVTDSAAAVGVVAFFRAIPMLVLGLIFGTLADRFPRIGVLAAIQITGILAAAGYSIIFLLGYEHLWVICALAALIGCAWAADFAARSALVAELNIPEQT
jgi:MFS family permease